MRYGIALLADRVAPRLTCADSLLLVVRRHQHLRVESTSQLDDHSLLDLAKVLSDSRVDILVCGGINREERDYLSARQIDVIDNVVASVDELLAALEADTLHSGFGFGGLPPEVPTAEPESKRRRPISDSESAPGSIDCLACRNRVCLLGEPCSSAASAALKPDAEPDSDRILETALDISFESERTLCRLSELIYFCLEMRYQRIGLAYCVDLEEPAAILTRVLRRFFKVYPVCCKIGGSMISDPLTLPTSTPERPPFHQVACNPAGQAEALNRLDTDINVLAGLCMGADCVFSRLSDAPVTTLFVKDKSLANNPIGAVYSDYYLKEAIQASRCDTGRESQQ